MRKTTSSATTEARISALEAALATERERIATLTAERDRLRASHERLRLEMELIKRRLFIAKAERIDTAQLELEFARTLAALDQLGPAPIGEEPTAPARCAADQWASDRRPAGAKRSNDDGCLLCGDAASELVSRGDA